MGKGCRGTRALSGGHLLKIPGIVDHHKLKRRSRAGVWLLFFLLLAVAALFLNAYLQGQPRDDARLTLVWRRPEGTARRGWFLEPGGTLLGDGQRLLFLDQAGQKIRELTGRPEILAATSDGVATASFGQNLVSYFSSQGALLWQWTMGEPVEGLRAGRELLLVNTRYNVTENQAPAAVPGGTLAMPATSGANPKTPVKATGLTQVSGDLKVGNRVILLDRRGRKLAQINLPQSLVTALALDPEEGHLAIAALSNQDYQTSVVRVFDRRGQLLWERSLGQGLVPYLGLFSHGEALWAQVDHRLIWLGRNAPPRETGLGDAPLLAAAPGGWLAVGTRDSTFPQKLLGQGLINVFDPGGTLRWQRRLSKVAALSWSGNTLLVGTENSLLAFAETGKSSWRMELPGQLDQLLVDPGGQKILTIIRGGAALYQSR